MAQDREDHHSRGILVRGGFRKEDRLSLVQDRFMMVMVTFLSLTVVALGRMTLVRRTQATKSLATATTTTKRWTITATFKKMTTITD